eukprot:403367067
MPNLQVRGQTFDVRHLDQFIQYDNTQRMQQQLMSANQSQAAFDTNNPSQDNLMVSNSGRQMINSMPKRAQTAAMMAPQQQMFSKRQSKLSNIPVVFTNVRPSTSFITISRDNKAQSKFIDEQKSGPSFLIRREGVPTLKQLESQGQLQLHYNTERKAFNQLNDHHKQLSAQIANFQGKQDQHGEILIPNTDLKFPSQRRSDIQQAKDTLREYQEIKSQKIFIKKRNRLIQSQWRDGIVGVEVPGDKGSIFYSQKLLRDEQRAQKRLEKRTDYLKDKTGQSSQINFYSNDNNQRHDQKEVPMFHGWTQKKISEVRFRNTQDNLFGEVKNNWNSNRAQKLICEETKGRPFNPVSGTQHFLLS